MMKTKSRGAANLGPGSPLGAAFQPPLFHPHPRGRTLKRAKACAAGTHQ
jgi:hypothetical protein